MTKKKEKKIKQEIQLKDILSLNIHQFVILFLLSIQPSETFRYSLLQDINKYIFPEAKLSASSFYNTLERLESLGLVEMVAGENGKTKSVRGTNKIKKALEIISNYTVFLSFNPEIIFGSFLPIFESFIKLGKIKNVLFIDFDEFFDIGLTSLLKKHSEEFFLLADDQSFEKYQNRSSEKIFQTQAINGKIREPDDIFDLVFITDYCVRENIYNMNEKSLLQEAFRITKKGGKVIVLATEELPITNNLFLDSIAKNLKNSPLMITISAKIFFESIESVIPLKPQFYNSNGLLVAKIEKT